MRYLKISKNVNKKLIMEALKCWKECCTSTGFGRDEFQNKMYALNWNYFGNGSFKRCMRKDDIIIKFAANPKIRDSLIEVSREVEQWRHAPRWLMKYLPKIYAFRGGLLVQERVYNNSCDDCEAIREIKDKHKNLYDCEQNHGHDKMGQVKFFDWVYNRNGKWYNDESIPLSIIKK